MRICEESLCCGCSMCEAVCPKDAIVMTADCEGFLRPCVNEEKCVECGLCQKKCPVNAKAPSSPIKVYAAYAKDKEIRKTSSSGGIFSVIAGNVIKNQGVVFGAAFDENMRVVHKAATDEKSLLELRTSKYVQSDMSGVYEQIKAYLESKKQVMFSGTPCQCAAVKNMFGRCENLILVDFICHGVPTPMLWEKYLHENHEGAYSASFRDKKLGWEEFSMRVDSAKGTYNCSRYKDPYLRMFLANVALRPSCYNCSWKNPGFCSDITLGDFWGVSKVNPAWNDNKGTSVVIVRSPEGESLVESAAKELEIFDSEERASVRGNGMYDRSTPVNPRREEFFEKISKGASFEELKNEYARPLKGTDILKIRLITKAKVVLGKVSCLRKR